MLITKFCSTISHDIKNPLTNLVLAIDLFKKVAPGDEKKFQSLLKIVDNALSKMHNLITDLTSERKSAYNVLNGAELLSLEHILEDVRLTLNDNITFANAKIKTEINCSEITFSRRKLRTILYNLINNAIKFKSPHRDPQIFITAEKEDEYMVITVKDNGLGIEKSKLKAIFSKYYRLENNVEGSGIGLYLVNEIVTNAGGKVCVESEIDKGTEFKVHLKIHPETT